MVDTPHVRHQELDLPHGRLHYVEAGSGEPRTLLPGGQWSWTQWIANIGPVAARKRVPALDLPRFGPSFTPKPEYSIDPYAGIVSPPVGALQIERAAIAGFSFG